MTDPKYFEEIEHWRQERENNLRAPDGWLTVVGLHWLAEGTNYIGTGPNNDIVLPAGTAPEHIGVLDRKGEEVHLKVDPKVRVFIDRNQVQEASLKPDTFGEQTVVEVGELTLLTIVRGERVGIRVKQENHPNRSNFPGRDWYPPKKVLRIPAVIFPYTPPKNVPIENVLGDIEESSIDARLEFAFGSKEYSLDAYSLEDGRYQILFKDKTSGGSTYPAGRYVVTEKAENKQVVIDFNKAYNPPCAFTDFATCPLPPPQNLIALDIRAGEKYVKFSKT